MAVPQRILATLLDELDAPRFDDIAIRPFRLTYDGVLFGLIDESSADRGDWAPHAASIRAGVTQVQLGRCGSA